MKHSHALAKADKHGTKQMHALPDPFHTPTLTSEDGNIKNTHNLKTSTNCILLLKIPHTWTNTQSNAQWFPMVHWAGMLIWLRLSCQFLLWRLPDWHSGCHREGSHEDYQAQEPRPDTSSGKLSSGIMVWLALHSRCPWLIMWAGAGEYGWKPWPDINPMAFLHHD